MESTTNTWTNKLCKPANTLYLTYKQWLPHTDTSRVIANKNLRQVSHDIMSTQTDVNGPNSTQYTSESL